ncbi:MAG: hypothetical protein KGJ78_07750 [Alphaproteobacteria bacterium]|nr:hypothetical protein [Alphaproteobacteria bacterium]
MQRRTLLLMAAASAVAAAAATAAPWDQHDNRRGRRHDDWSGRNHRDWRDDHGNWHSDHDRYWRPDYRDRHYVDRDRIFGELRRRRYRRFAGDPYWFQGRYVVRTYDRWGNVVFVEMDPYTGAFIGVIRF